MSEDEVKSVHTCVYSEEYYDSRKSVNAECEILELVQIDQPSVNLSRRQSLCDELMRISETRVTRAG
jgi:hypothetical protein